MDGDALKKKIQKIVLTPDEAPTLAQDIIADIDAAITEIAGYTDKVATLEKKTRDLQDSNIKLFLAQTSDKPEESQDDEEKSIEQLEEEFIDMVIGGDKDGDKH